MEDIAFLIFCLLSIINIDVKGINSFFDDYIELKNTFSVKGIFVWLIVFNHHSQYIRKKNIYITKLFIMLVKKWYHYFSFILDLEYINQSKIKEINMLKLYL